MRDFTSALLLIICLLIAAFVGWDWLLEGSDFGVEPSHEISDTILFVGCTITAALCCRRSE